MLNIAHPIKPLGRDVKVGASIVRRLPAGVSLDSRVSRVPLRSTPRGQCWRQARRRTPASFVSTVRGASRSRVFSCWGVLRAERQSHRGRQHLVRKRLARATLRRRRVGSFTQRRIIARRDEHDLDVQPAAVSRLTSNRATPACARRAARSRVDGLQPMRLTHRRTRTRRFRNRRAAIAGPIAVRTEASSSTTATYACTPTGATLALRVHPAILNFGSGTSRRPSARARPRPRDKMNQFP